MSDPLGPLTLSLRDQILRDGPLSLAEYMAQALYDPAHGYYGAGRARIGRRGDFFTSISVGPLFGRLLARQFAEIWERLSRPADFVIAEQGAHTGEFAADALAALRDQAPDCFAATTYWLIEPAAAPRAAQAEKLSSFTEKVRWAESVAALPPFRGVHFSNELVDAFPVHRVKWTGEQWSELAVDWRGDAFAFVERSIIDPPLREAAARLPEVPAGYETEINLAAAPWLTAVADRLEEGVILAIDYGFSRAEYYRPERASGTLSAYADHQRADPLTRPGEIDLTAHVDFTSLAEAALAAGLALAGFVDQHHLMVGLGRLHFTDETSTPSEIRAFKTLMHPEMLGRSFRAFGAQRGGSAEPLAGFHFGGDPQRALFTS